MTIKVLVADDSKTIQKVVALTLAKEPYELIEALDFDSMLEAFEENDFKVVLLDYGLSDTKGIAEVLNAIYAKDQEVKVILMQGSFDSVNSKELKQLNIIGSIVKPFDASELIEVCRKAVDGEETLEDDDTDDFGQSSMDFSSSDHKVNDLNLDHENEETEISFNHHDDDDEESSLWEVSSTSQPATLPSTSLSSNSNSSSNSSSNSIEELDLSNSASPLKAELSDWGIEVPPTGSQKDLLQSAITRSRIEVPPVIDAKIKEESKELAKKPSFTSMEDLALSEDEIQESLNEQNLLQDETNHHNIEELVNSGMSSKDFWKADDDVSKTLKDEVTTTLKEQINKNSSSQLKEQSSGSLNEKQTQEIIEKWLDDNGKAVIEKVAWEILPDLAENLINKRLKAIENKILNDSTDFDTDQERA